MEVVRHGTACEPRHQVPSAHFSVLSDFTCVCVCWLLSYVRLFVTPQTIAHQVSLSMEFSRQEYRSELPFLSPEELSKPGSNPGLLHHSQRVPSTYFNVLSDFTYKLQTQG